MKIERQVIIIFFCIITIVPIYLTMGMEGTKQIHDIDLVIDKVTKKADLY